MARLAALPLAALALVAFVSAQALQKPQFFPPRIKSAELPPLPSPNVAGGGEVLIEGARRSPRRGDTSSILRATPPYTQFVLDAIARWQFEPARDIDYKGLETTVEMPVTVVAIYRPPVLMNAPTIGEPPKDLMKPSGDVAVATRRRSRTIRRAHVMAALCCIEISLDETGALIETRHCHRWEALTARRARRSRVSFRRGSYRARPVPTTTYVSVRFPSSSRV